MSKANASHRRHEGIAYLLALVLLAVFAAVACAMLDQCGGNIAKADNFRMVTDARFAAESGLSVAMRQMRGIMVEGSDPNMLSVVYATLRDRFDGTNGLLANAVTLDSGNPAHPVVRVPNISLPSIGVFSFTADMPASNVVRLTVTGVSGRATRKLGVNYKVCESTRVLTYAVASRPRIIGRGNVQVDGDLCSTWRRTAEAPPLDIRLGSDAQITGDIKTVLSHEEFTQDHCQDYITQDLQGKLGYDEPSFAEYTTADFNTSVYKTRATGSLPTPTSRSYEWFPETKPTKRFYRKFYVGASTTNPMVLNNVSVPANNNAHFKACKFTGYTYIEQPNNIVFENCTFEGPIITGVPSDFQWIDNSLYFKGDTVMRNAIMPESTILAPNFNVNIGDFSKQGVSSDSKITGIIVGGIVDVRDNVVIEGTILSMANLDNITASIIKYGTNLGYWEGDAEEGGGVLPTTTFIKITPQPSNPLPLGMQKKYTLSVDPASYVELSG